MLEFTICSLLTILPDYLIRHYVQGKRIGHEITLYSVWFELRYGITACAILTLSLITVIFYFHPASDNVRSFFRTVTILPETPGRVEQVFVQNNQEIRAGDPIFRMDAARQQTARDTAARQIEEIDAQIVLAAAELSANSALVAQAQANLAEAERELARTQELADRGSSAVSEQELDRRRARAEADRAALAAAISQEEAARAKVETLLPAQRASAQAALAQAEVELSLTTVYAGVDGTMEQFALQPGDYVSSILRPAGIIVPHKEEVQRMQAGFGQISGQVIHPGMMAEITCNSVPFTVIPMVIVDVQDVISTGQIRPTDQLVDVADGRAQGTIVAFMEPLYEGGLDPVIRGSTCVANAYTSNHDRLEDPELSGVQRIALHVVDTVGLVHAFMLRIHALLLPVRTLVLSGGH